MIDVQRDEVGLRVEVESPAPSVMGCPVCGVIAHAHGRQQVKLIDAPCFAAPVRLWWRKRRWVCPEPLCPVTSFMEQDPAIAPRRGLLTARATRWAIAQMRRENASVQGLARQLGCTWKTLWRSVRPVLEAAAADETRSTVSPHWASTNTFETDVSTKPVDLGGRGPKEFTGMVDLTRDQQGRVRARLLDLVPGRSGEAYKTWLKARGDRFRKGIEVATLDPFHGYKNAIDDQLEDAIAVVDAYHIVKLGTAAVDDVRRRVQQDIHGHRGRKNDPLYRIRNILRAGQENLTDRQRARLEAAFAADERHVEVEVAWRCAQQLRSVLPPTQPRRRAQGHGKGPRVVPDLPDSRTPDIGVWSAVGSSDT